MRRWEVFWGWDAWEAMKITMKGVDVWVALFNTLASHARGGPLRLRYFRHVGVTPHLYDRFVGAWGMFPPP